MRDREIFDVAMAMFDRYGVAGAIIAAQRAALLMQEETVEEENGANEIGRGSIRDRPWVGIHFDCCFVYTRIYRNASGTAYAGRCPRCMRNVSLRIGPGGTDARFFVAE